MKNITFFFTKCDVSSLISNIFLFLTVFSVVVDPTNEILKIKNISFIIFVLFSIKNGEFNNIIKYLLLIVIYYITYLFQLMFPSCFVDAGTANAILKSFIYLFIIFFMGKNQKNHVFKYFFYVNFCVAIFCLIIWILIMILPSIEYPLYLYFMRRENFTLTISHRVFIGIKVFGVFYKTCVFAVICLSYSLYQYLFRKNKKYFLYSIIFFLYLFASGTRANMLSSILILGGIWAYYLFKKGRFALLSFILFIGGTLAMFLIIKLMSDTGETSVAIKALHKESYWNLFDSNIIRYCLIGDGPGSTFYTKGWEKLVVTTELSYYELVRNYGIIFSLIMLFIFFDPIISIYNNYKDERFFIFLLSFISYMFIAGTNPYLIGSTGFTTIAIMYYIGAHDIDLEMIHE